MILSALAAVALLSTAQCLLVLYAADKLTPGTSDDRNSTQHPAGITARYA